MSFLAKLWAHEIYWNSDVRFQFASLEDWRAAERKAWEKLVSAHFDC
jgi:hypothetical protein